MAFGSSILRVDSNAVRYFREDVPFRETIAVIERDISGPMSYEVVADSMRPDGIKEPAFMQSVERFADEFLATFPEARHAASLVDVVKKFNEIVAFDKSIPEDKNLIAQYLLLYSLSLPQGMEINDKMDIDEQRLRISLSMNVSETSRDLEMIAWIEQWWSKTPYSAEVNGQSVMFANMQSDVTKTLIESILLALLLISFVMFFIFRRVGMIPIILIPNVLPIALVIGAMGWLGMSIDIGVAISGAIILGIAVDDSIHFLLKYKEAQKRGCTLEESLAFVMEYAGFAMIFTTVVLSTAFITFHFSQFMLNANFGLITAIALFIALGVDLLLLPAILALIDKKRIKNV
jgi:predicted RND superfamily exporter protein